MPPTKKLQHIRTLLDAIKSGIGGGNHPLLLGLRRRALEQSLPVYLVGGPVRDALLGAPIKDLDFAIEGDASAVARELAHELGGQVVTHTRFGTATVVLGDCRVDLATARKETYSHPGALPDVAPGTIYDDLARRDFSVNALALPLAEGQPKVLDPHGGVDDLKAGLIRILHRDSFVDDPTRVYRAIRYEQRLGFYLEEETLSQLQHAIAEGSLASISGDRVRHELERILHEEHPDLALRRCIQLGVLAAIHPSFGNAQDLIRLATGGPFDSTQGDPSTSLRMSGVEPLAYLATLAYRLSSPAGEAVAHRLNLPGSWVAVMRDTICLKEREPELARSSLSRSRLCHLVAGFAPAAVAAVARITDSPLASQRLEQYLRELRFIVPALNGRDLVAMGVPQGPLVGEILRELQTAKLDQRISTEAEERQLAREFLATKGG